MQTFGDVAARLSRTPLGVIGLALVFVYALACVLGFKGKFNAMERRWLILFIVFFPILILTDFSFLIVYHHEKLYAPSDFANESNFVALVQEQVAKSPEIKNLEAVTRMIESKIENQPLYRYTKLLESGKQLILIAYSDESVDLASFARERSFSLVEVRSQAEILTSQYGWVSFDGVTIKLTNKGHSEVSTFQDLAFGRLK